MATQHLSLTSTAFEDGASIPPQYTCDGAQVSPPLSIAGVPPDTRSFLLIMDDPDIPEVFKQQSGISVFDHWVLFDIPPETTEIPEGASGIGVEGGNGMGKTGYIGPCPPTQYEPKEHRYIFKLAALDMTLGLPAGATRQQVEKAMGDHVLARAQLMGMYQRSE